MNTILNAVAKANDAVNGVVWGWPALILLAFVGVFTTCITKFFQLVHLKHWFRNTIGAIFLDKHITKHTKDRTISQFQSLCTTLAATVGTGNIAGVASAIVTGGPGAVFWMWCIAFFSMMTIFSENVLGILYRVRNQHGEWSGGAMYYLKYGLGAKRGCKQIGKILAVLFAFFCLMASFGIGNMTQVNTIAKNMQTAFSIPTFVSGIAILIIAGLVIIGGIKRIALVTEKIVPIMVFAYLFGTLFICVVHIGQFKEVFTSIFKSAFGLKAAAGGIVGSGVKMAVQMGLKRGIFSNEAGLGSTVMANSSSNVKEPVRQGMWGIFEVFGTLVVCTLTAFSVLSSGLINLESGQLIDKSIDAGSLVGVVFKNTFGAAGSWFVAIVLLMFAFSTILGWSHYGTKACEYLFGTESTLVYRIIFVIAIYGGAVMGENLAWNLSDTFNGLMMLPNLVGVLILSPTVYRCTKNYSDRHFRHKEIKPMLSVYDDVQKIQEEALKHEEND